MKGSLVSLGFPEIMISCQTLTVKMTCILINDFYSVKKINDQSVCLYMQSCIFYMCTCVCPLYLSVHTQSERPQQFYSIAKNRKNANGPQQDNGGIIAAYSHNGTSLSDRSHDCCLPSVDQFHRHGVE